MAERKIKTEDLPEDAKVREAESQLMDDFKEEDYEGFGVIRIYHPTMEITAKVSEFYNKEFNRLLKDTDTPTISEMEDILYERGSWSEKREIELEQLREKMRRLWINRSKVQSSRNKNNKKTSDKEIERLDQEILKFNRKLIDLSTRKEMMFEGTIERQAQRNTLFYKIVHCVTNEKDEPIWKSIEDLQKERQHKIQKIIDNCMTFWSGLDNPLSGLFADQVFGS